MSAFHPENVQLLHAKLPDRQGKPAGGAAVHQDLLRIVHVTLHWSDPLIQHALITHPRAASSRKETPQGSPRLWSSSSKGITRGIRFCRVCCVGSFKVGLEQLLQGDERCLCSFRVAELGALVQSQAEAVGPCVHCL